MKRSARIFGLVMTLAVALLAMPAPAGADESEASLVGRARALGIAKSRAWRNLLHYRSSVFGGWTSEAEDRAFFLAPAGKRDPEAELEATLTAFFAPVRPGEEDSHPLCRFPARRHLLDHWLHFQGTLATPICPALTRYEEELDARSVAIVYSANYLGNPASAFGHTLLRLEKRRRERAGGVTNERDEKRDHGVDFMGTTDTRNPILYAFKGLTGLFPGHFQTHPYEELVREYGNLEARDLWEYDLALTDDEMNLLVLHLWELAATHIDYYYLTRNCSFEVLAAIEAAAPRLDLLSHLKFVVLPKDTIQVVAAVPGLVRNVEYRPSLRSRFREQAARLNSTERSTAETLTLNPLAPIPRELSVADAVETLDTAVFVLDARFARQLEIAGDPKLVAARNTLIERRLALSRTLPSPPVLPAPADKAPDRGPGVMRFTLGSGITSQYGDAFETLGYRLALHDLADPPDGEAELSQVQFLDTRLRYDVARSHLSLDRLTFAEVVALNPLTRYEHALSWSARAFGARLHDKGCLDCFAHGMDVAVGATWATADERIALFLMADAYVAFSGSLDGMGGSFVRTGVGPFGGFRVHLPDETVAFLTGTASYLPDAHLHTTYDVHADLRRPLAKNLALGVEGVAQPASREIQLASYLYF